MKASPKRKDSRRPASSSPRQLRSKGENGAVAGKPGRQEEAGPSSLTAPETFVLYKMPGHLIRRLQQVAVSLFVQSMEEVGTDLTPVQYAALKAVQNYPSIDQATLAGVIAYDRTTIGGVVDRLESKGLVRRQLSSSDRRVRQLVLERAGHALLTKIEPKVAQVQEKMLAPLGTEEQLIFVMLLKKLTKGNNEQSRAPLRPITGRGPGPIAAE